MSNLNECLDPNKPKFELVKKQESFTSLKGFASRSQEQIPEETKTPKENIKEE